MSEITVPTRLATNIADVNDRQSELSD